jgi:hypothetical protein
MPIGKNSIKRAVNNGYSNVKTSAPDMENSEVVITEEKVKKAAKAPAKKPTAKKACAPKKAAVAPEKTEPKKAVAPKKATPKKAPVEKTVKKDGFARVEVGGEMPYYLL